MPPLSRMIDDPGTNHIQIYVKEASNQVFFRIDGCGMITILPKSTVPFFPPVICLGRSTGDKLNRFWNNLSVVAPVYQEVNVI